jgi:hypothetical protein
VVAVFWLLPLVDYLQARTVCDDLQQLQGRYLPKTIKAHLLLVELQAEARAERFAESFDQHFEDNDEPWGE